MEETKFSMLIGLRCCGTLLVRAAGVCGGAASSSSEDEDDEDEDEGAPFVPAGCEAPARLTSGRLRFTVLEVDVCDVLFGIFPQNPRARTYDPRTRVASRHVSAYVGHARSDVT